MEESEEQRKLSCVVCITLQGLGKLRTTVGYFVGLDNRVWVEKGEHQWEASFTSQFYPAYFNATENHGERCLFDTYVIRSWYLDRQSEYKAEIYVLYNIES